MCFQDEFYQQLQAVRKPWRIPSDTESDCMEPPEQDKCEYSKSDPVFLQTWF